MTDEIEKVSDEALVVERESSKSRLSRLVSTYWDSAPTKKALWARMTAINEEIDAALIECGLRRNAAGEILAVAYPETPPLLTLTDDLAREQVVLRTAEGRTVLSVVVQSRGIVVPGNLSEPERSYDYDVQLVLDAIADIFELRLEQKRLREPPRDLVRGFSFGGGVALDPVADDD